MPKDQLLDCWSASIYNDEEKITRTEMVAKLMDAKDSVFTVSFRKMKHAEDVQQALKGIKSAKDLQNRRRKLAKQMVEGEPCTITGHLLKSENHLGRSMVIDLNQPYGKGFRLIDHRTIYQLVLQNVKYSIK